MGIGICDNDKCKYSKNCIRFLTKNGEILNFKAICNEETNYKWYWKNETDIVTKEGK